MGLPTALLYWGPSTWLAKTPDILGNFKPGPSPNFMLYARVTPASDDRWAEELAWEMQADLDGQNPVRALARWRCSLTYRRDADLPSPERRVEIARAAAALAQQAEMEGKTERALRNYSVCAVIGLSSVSPSVSCRMNAERLRAMLFPRRSKRHRASR